MAGDGNGMDRLPSPAPDVSRKKLQSIARDEGFWAGEEQAAVRTRQEQGIRQVLAKLLVPGIFSRHDYGLQQTASLLADISCLVVNFMLIGGLRMLGDFVPFRNVPSFVPSFPSAAEFGVLLIYGALLTLLGYAERLYRPDTIRKPWEQKIVLAKVVVWSSLLVAAAVRLSGTHVISIAALVLGALFNYLTMLGWRQGWQWLRARRIQRGGAERNVLIVGAGTLGRRVAAWLQQDRFGGRVVVGFLDSSGAVGGDVLGRIEDLAGVARAKFVDEVIVALPHQHDLAKIVAREARRKGLDIRLVLDLQGFEPGAAALENCGGIPLLTLHRELIPELELFLKRALDVMLSAAGLVVTAPLLAAIALVIKLDSRGPVFYRAPRAGKKGNCFPCHKFRTMVTDADTRKELLRPRNERHGACFKINNDPRITRVGRFLRRYSLDELPQLWNVLCGDMSLVGPRPHPLDDFEQYDLEDLRRLEVTPGITGLWQVTARRDPSFQRNVALDVEYIEHWNLWMDLRILCRTVSVVLQGSGV